MNDTNERSVASAVFVGEPLAFAVIQPDSYVVVHSLHSAFAMRDMCGGGDIIPLYRHPQPTLTDAEREAIEECVRFAFPARHPTAVTLRGLLERLK
jgi:hypothetical protein